MANVLLKGRLTIQIGTCNVRSLRGMGKGEQLAMEMERNRLTILGVTETHMPGSGVHTHGDG